MEQTQAQVTDKELHWRKQILRQAERLDFSKDRAIAHYQIRLNRALQKGSVAGISRAWGDLSQVIQEVQASLALREQILEIAGGGQPLMEENKSCVPRYCISSTTLAEAFAYLTRRLPGADGEPEWMLAVSGLKVGGIRTLENLIEVQLSSQSIAQAAFDINDFTRVAVILHEHDMGLHAIFHSHRFKGPPHPSGTDNTLQRILEEGGYPLIQAVFSEDGYVRFFARRPFSLDIHGKGVMPIEQELYLYRILQFDTLPHPATQAKHN
jgi:hypothetical protein